MPRAAAAALRRAGRLGARARRRLGPGECAPLERSRAGGCADAKPADRPWTTILLLGTDEGPGNWGARTDTIILVAIQHGTGRAAAFGIPRNLAQVPLGGSGKPSRRSR